MALRCFLALFWFALALQGWCQSDRFVETKALAEKGNADAQMSLASHLDTEKNYAEAVKWFRKAAEQSDSDGQNSLGYYCYQGLGVEKSYAEAVKWFRKSAEQGNGNGQWSLGGCYRDGKGVNKDLVEAYAWFNLAASSRLLPDALRVLESSDPRAIKLAQGIMNEEGQMRVMLSKR